MRRILIGIAILSCVNGFCQKTKNGFSDVFLIDVRGNEFCFTDSIRTPSIILYYSEPNCHACIDEIISLLLQKNIKNFYVIAQDRNDVIYRKQVLKRFSTLTNTIQAIYFDNIKRNYPFNKSVSSFNKSPWIVFYTNKFDVFANEEIFDSKSSELKFSKSFLKRINKFESLVVK